MRKIILGFLPWILYFVFLGTTRQQHETAILAALGATVILDFHEIRKGFVLVWGTLLFFIGLLATIWLVAADWPEQHANLIANSALAFIAWFSLAINKPFTIQYAREQVPALYWPSPTFIRINQLITLVWAISFLIAVAMNVLQLYGITLGTVTDQIISYLPSIFAIWFTKFFPDWYKAQRMQKIIDRSEQQQINNPFLQGNFAPIHDQLDVTNLPVEGQIPHDLTGIYMRNGANPAFPPFSYTYPFDGDGMLHALYFKEGKVNYKNRYVETEQLKTEQRIGKAMYGGVSCPMIRDEKLLIPTDSRMPVKTGRFIHIIRHAERYLALHETASAYEVNARLETQGEWNPTHAEEAWPVDAHTRLDPDKGELYFIAYHGDKKVISYLILDKNAKVTQTGEITVPYNCMVHDFVLTQNYVVIFLCPVVVDFSRMISGKPFAEWKPELNTRIAVIPRANLAEVSWIETEAFFNYHFANAYEKANEIFVDYVRYPDFSMDTTKLKSAHLYRAIINTHTKQCDHQQLDQNSIEFPRINDQLNSKNYRYIYAAVNLDNNNHEVYQAIIKYDLITGEHTMHNFGEHYELGEAVFAAKENTNAEDAGYLMFFAYNKISNSSDFIILDAQAITAAPVAKIKLPRRVPHGLHGSWMAGEW